MLDTLRHPFDTATRFILTEPINRCLMKKFFGRKRAESKQPDDAVSDQQEAGLYARHTADEPLDEYTDGLGREVRRTSRHSPARRREVSNRASDREVLFLLLRTGLILAVVVGGFFALKFVVGVVSKPSETQKKQWEDAAVKMEKSSESVESAMPNVDVVGMSKIDETFISSKMAKWQVAEQYFRSAEAFERRGMLEQAAERLLQALEVAPENRPAQILLLSVYEQAENDQAIAALCIRLLDQDSRDHDVKRSLLAALEKMGELQATVALGAELLEENPRDVVVLATIASAQEQLGMVESAISSYGRLLQQEPSSRKALEGLGRLSEQSQAWGDAIPYYLSLVKLEPLPEYYHALARCYAQQVESGKAVIFLGQAASLFGEKEVSSWLRTPVFDSIRETADFRSFADRVVGVETRKAIESIRQREAARQSDPALPGGGIDVPRPELNQLKPGN
jgi:tetratricopeptide (TPR) repeat protein